MKIHIMQLKNKLFKCDDCNDTADYLIEGIGGKSGYTYLCKDCKESMLAELSIENIAIMNILKKG